MPDDLIQRTADITILQLLIFIYRFRSRNLSPTAALANLQECGPQNPRISQAPLCRSLKLWLKLIQVDLDSSNSTNSLTADEVTQSS
jgi:hypothetical protein